MTGETLRGPSTGISIFGWGRGVWGRGRASLPPLFTVICPFLVEKIPVVTLVRRPGLGSSHSIPNMRGGPSLSAGMLRVGRWGLAASLWADMGFCDHLSPLALKVPSKWPTPPLTSPWPERVTGLPCLPSKVPGAGKEPHCESGKRTRPCFLAPGCGPRAEHEREKASDLGSV